MKLDQSFDVQAPVTVVWSTLIDVQRVAPCLPGAEITEAGDDGAYRGTFKVKLGPTTAEYRGTLRMEHLDEEARVATMRADGSDKRGQGGAKATIVSRLTEHEGATRVEVETDFAITGRLARFGRGGMIEDISNRLLRDFASCLQSELGASPPAGGEPADPDPEPGGETGSVEADPPVVDDRIAAEAGAAADDTRAAPAGGGTPRPPREPLDAGALVGGVVRDRLKEAAPLVLVALLLGFLLGRGGR